MGFPSRGLIDRTLKLVNRSHVAANALYNHLFSGGTPPGSENSTAASMRDEINEPVHVVLEQIIRSFVFAPSSLGVNFSVAPRALELDDR